MKVFFKRALSCTSIFGLAFVHPAHAQAGLAEGTDDGVSDIIVTAQKREQRLQDVPVAVTAVSSETLQVNRVQSVTDLTGLAPGLMTRENAGSRGAPSLYLRGVSAGASLPSQDRQISQYLDGVYIGGTSGAIFDLPDIERIEVLRGPQGTLFGRNATAGAISIVTRDPTGEFGLRQEVTLGNYDQIRTRTSIDLPAFGPFSAYATYVHDERRGDVRNLGAGTVFDRTNPFNDIGLSQSPKYLGSRNFENIFAALKFAPEGSAIDATYKFYRSNGEMTPEARATTVLNPRDTVGGLLAGVLAAQPTGGGAYGPVFLNPSDKRPDAYNNAWTQPGFIRNYGHNFTARWQASDSLSFKSITAYREAKTYSPNVTAGLSGLELTQAALPAFARFVAISRLGAAFFAQTPDQQQATINGFATSLSPQVGRYFADSDAQTFGKSWQFSSELQANYDSDTVNVTAGAIYYRSFESYGGPPGFGTSIAFQPVPTQIPLGNLQDSRARTRSVAAYMQAEFDITSRLNLQLGGRITQDRKVGSLETGGTLVGSRTDGAITGTTVFPWKFKKTKPSFSVGLNYKPSDASLLYGKFSTAFLSGGAVGQLSFLPETATSWEGGFKSDWFDRRLRLNVAVYRSRYKNLQQAQSGIAVGLPQFSTVVIDNGKLTTKGVEVELTAAPAQGLTFGGGFGYVDAKLTDPNPLAAQGQPYRYTGAPKLTGSVNAQYITPPLFDDATLLMRVDGNYQSKFRSIANPNIENVVPEFGPYEFNPGRWLVNGRVALRNVAIGPGNIEIGVWGKNLFNNRDPLFPFSFGSILVSSSYQKARTFGVDLIATLH